MVESQKNLQPGSRKRCLLCLVLLIFATSGCALLFPKKAALQTIHDSYRGDFQQFQLGIPQPGPEPGHPAPALDQAPFAETIREIRDYRVKYGETSAEAAHLKVLEGMIYLQSNQFGMASLVAKDVADAASRLQSGTGDDVRDQLLAKNFGSLIKGWRQIPMATVDNAPRDLNDAAKAIGDSLPKATTAPSVDEGAIYLATNAAIFYVWAYHYCSLAPSAPPPCGPTRMYWFTKGKDLINQYLTPTERMADATALPGTVPPGRIRYIRWYVFLSNP